MPRLFRVIAVQHGKFEWRGLVFQHFGSHPAPGRPLGHVIAWTGVPTGSQSTVLFAYAFLGTVVFWSLRRIARCPRSWHSRNLRGGRDRGDGNTTNSPRRRDTVALAPHFQGPRPKDRGSVGSTQVCRWPPGGVSGALRPPQSPQDLEETSLTSLWQPHRKVKQRGRKARVSGLLLGTGAPLATKTLPPSPFVSFPGFSSHSSR